MHLSHSIRLLLLICFCGLATTRIAHAEDVVWSGLIYASTVSNPAPPPKEVAEFSRKLEHIFGYNQLQLLSQHREVMDSKAEHWLVPGQGYYLLVDTKRMGVNYLLRLQLYQESKQVVQTTALLARQSPIFLRGPLYGEGQLIIVLAVE